MILRKKSAIWLTILMGLIILCLACGGQTNEANKLIDEANALVDKSRPLTDKVDNLINDLLGSKMTQAEDINEYKTDNKAKFDEIVSVAEEAEKNLSEAAGKLEQASKMPIGEKFKEYISIKAQEFRKRAERQKETAAFIKAFLAENDVSKANQIIADNNKKDADIRKEANDLGEKARKIEKDNPGLFKPN